MKNNVYEDKIKKQLEKIQAAFYFH